MDNDKTLVAVVILALLAVVAVIWGGSGSGYSTLPVPPPVLSPSLIPSPLPITDPRDVTLMVVIPEECIQQRVPDPAAETALIREFLLSNFRVVDQGRVAEIRYTDAALLAARGEDPEALKALQALAIEYNADVLIIGEAFGEGAGTSNGLQSVRARVEVRAIMARTGQIIASEAVHMGGVDLTFNTACKMALQNGGEAMGKMLSPQFLQRFGHQSTNFDRVELIVTSLPFSLYADFKNNVSSLPNVRDVVADHYSAQQSQISVTYTGDLMDLIQQIVVLELGGRSIEVLTYTSTRVTFKLVE